MSRIFAMVSTAASKRYTPGAVESFFQKTNLESSERLIVIDNDGAVESLPHAERLEILWNRTPLSFAQNVNAMLKRSEGSDLYFLNNDIIFTRNWILPLESITDAIVTPVSNREFQYTKDALRCERYLTLEDYLGNEKELETIVDHHQSKMSGYRAVFYLPFFCVKIPAVVSSKLGPLDESFGKGGAEDNDYCVRAHIEGFRILYAMNSYLLHFSGKSTWHGGETPEETLARDEAYLKRLDEKWGQSLRKLSIAGDLSVLLGNQELLKAFQRGDFRTVVSGLRS